MKRKLDSMDVCGHLTVILLAMFSGIAVTAFLLTKDVMWLKLGLYAAFGVGISGLVAVQIAYTHEIAKIDREYHESMKRILVEYKSNKKAILEKYGTKKKVPADEN